jgi:hypothetical protein
MTGTDWLLSLHILSAVALGAAMTGFWALVISTRSVAGGVSRLSMQRVSKPLTVVVSVGSIGALVFGVWLAIVEDAYQPWDLWIIAAIVLWAVGTELGRRAGTAFESEAIGARRQGVLLHAVSSVSILLILLLMIWKPGS